MLAYEVMIWRAGDADKERPWELCVANWMTGVFGLDWLQDLEKTGLVEGWAGNGYPYRFRIQVGTLLESLADGLPGNASPPIHGEDYFLPAGFNGSLKLDLQKLRSCPVDEWLDGEAWDQS
ncbi:hypothetical protein [Pseudoxanthomonas mexicana]|uniref:hypothetical protein n=1 Tax=Pseudoxanthomonas mexicana TaxID=128785 RepID=UPI00398AD3C3